MGDLLESINPATGVVLARRPQTTGSEVELILEKAVKAQRIWKEKSFGDRAQALNAFSKAIKEAEQELAFLMAAEMGKPWKQGVAEVEKCAQCLSHFAQHGAEYLRDETVQTEAAKSYVSRHPLGVVLGIMPWNFPLWQVIRALAPTLMAGNGFILKHASNVSGCALALLQVAQNALPPDIFSIVLISGSEASKLISDPRINAVTLTGSTEAGKKIAAAAGQRLKKCVLELGGSDPYLVLEDADVAVAAKICTTSRLINAGQSCISAKRFIVHSRIKNEFEEAMLSEMESKTIGPPLGEFDLGPLARKDLRDNLHGQVTRSLDKGAILLCGGRVPTGAGNYYPPTLLTQVKPETSVFREETFGPVAAIISAESEEEMIRLANDTSYGLGAAVFSRDTHRAEKIGSKIEAGNVFINDFVKSDVRMPFGGVKESGYGRELGMLGIREFVNAKTVWVA
ncbi:MAG: succinate-semialdehyde dehydrogenase [Verrucomicrobiales bacterium]|nr:succinate-semialdehyde dehydrogenase [Verrucomicrobiales bacterium]MDB6128987.1 succinate-semialdehyde dehydrogenase [Verrucomicrobiales bacterium]